MKKQSEIIKILSKKLSEITDCPAELALFGSCTGERCDRIKSDDSLCWVTWAAEQIKENDK